MADPHTSAGVQKRPDRKAAETFATDPWVAKGLRLAPENAWRGVRLLIFFVSSLARLNITNSNG